MRRSPPDLTGAGARRSRCPVGRIADRSTRCGGERAELKVVANLSRNGFFYTLDRASGQFLRADQYQEKVTWTRGICPKTGKPLADAQHCHGVPALKRDPCPSLAEIEKKDGWPRLVRHLNS
jgi:hypothetical protein